MALILIYKVNEDGLKGSTVRQYKSFIQKEKYKDIMFEIIIGGSGSGKSTLFVN